MTYRFILLLTCVYFVGFAPAYAKVALAPIFGNGAVLQRNTKIRLWGTATSHETVSVKIGNQLKSTESGANGQWAVFLDPLPAGANFALTVSSPTNSLTRHVLVGDVLLCSGQSNMNISIGESDSQDEDLKIPNKPSVSIFRMPDKDSGPYAGIWTVPDEADIKSMPAIPYLVAAKLARKSSVPIGVICAAASGAGIESFLPPETSARLRPPPNPDDRFVPGRNFKTLLEPLLNYKVCALLWYQGESNIRNAAAYRTIFPAFIADMRERMSSSKLPVYFVQLPGFGSYTSNPQSSVWAELRESQSYAASLFNVFMIASLDTTQDEQVVSLHPIEKRVVASRIADTIGTKWSPPVKNTYAIQKDAILINFSGKSGAVHTNNLEDPRAFQVAGSDKVFYPATADLGEFSALVRSDKVPHPLFVRYGWADFADCNVQQGNHPLLPFRSDIFPQVASHN